MKKVVFEVRTTPPELAAGHSGNFRESVGGLLLPELHCSEAARSVWCSVTSVTFLSSASTEEALANLPLAGASGAVTGLTWKGSLGAKEPQRLDRGRGTKRNKR